MNLEHCILNIFTLLPNPHRFIPLLSPPIFVSFFFNLSSIVCATCLLLNNGCHWRVFNQLGVSQLKKTDSPPRSYQLLSQEWVSGPTSPHHAGIFFFWLNPVCCLNCYECIGASILCVQKMLFLCSNLQTVALTIFLSFLRYEFHRTYYFV